MHTGMQPRWWRHEVARSQHQKCEVQSDKANKKIQSNIEASSPIGRTYKRADSVCPHEPFASRAFPQSVPPVPPGSVWLHVCGPTWLAQGQSVPLEAAMAADNANWHPVITTNCPTARNWADTLGGACLWSVCVSSACVQAKLKFCITLTLWENCFFSIGYISGWIENRAEDVVWNSFGILSKTVTKSENHLHNF